MMKISSTNTVGEVVSSNYRTSRVFESHRIDFCCNGNRMLSDVAQERNLDVHNLLQASVRPYYSQHSRQNKQFRYNLTQTDPKGFKNFPTAHFKK